MVGFYAIIVYTFLNVIVLLRCPFKLSVRGLQPLLDHTCFAPLLVQLHLPSGGGGRECWSPGKRSLRPSAEEREREREIPSLSAHESVSTSSHMSSGLKLLSPASEDHRKAVTDKLLAETGTLALCKGSLLLFYCSQLDWSLPDFLYRAETTASDTGKWLRQTVPS